MPWPTAMRSNRKSVFGGSRNSVETFCHVGRIAIEHVVAAARDGQGSIDQSWRRSVVVPSVAVVAIESEHRDAAMVLLVGGERRGVEQGRHLHHRFVVDQFAAMIADVEQAIDFADVAAGVRLAGEVGTEKTEHASVAGRLHAGLGFDRLDEVAAPTIGDDRHAVGRRALRRIRNSRRAAACREIACGGRWPTPGRS